jgi:hypothetical protein
MPEDIPPSIQSDSAPVISTGLNDEARADLSERFDSFWAEQDSKTADAPPAAPEAPKEAPKAPGDDYGSDPGDQGDPESKTLPIEVKPPVEKPRKSRQPSTKPPDIDIVDQPRDIKPPPAEERPEVEDDPNDPLENLEPHPAASPENKSHFKKIKDGYKNIKAELKLEREAYRDQLLAPLATALGLNVNNPEEVAAALKQLPERLQAIKTAAIDPKVQAENEMRLQVSRASGLERSISYKMMYVEPVRREFSGWLDEYSRNPQVQAVIDPAYLKQWAENEKKADPEQLNGSFFTEALKAVAPHVDPSWLRRMQANGDNIVGFKDRGLREKQEILQNPFNYDQWHQANQAMRFQNTRNQVLASAERAFETTHPHMKPTGPNDPVYAARYKRAEELMTPFVQEQEGTVLDPDTAAKFTLDYLYMEERLPELEKQNKEFVAQQEADKKEIARLKKELRTYGNVNGRELRPTVGRGNGKPAAPEKQKLSQLGSRGGLDDKFREWTT